MIATVKELLEAIQIERSSMLEKFQEECRKLGYQMATQPSGQMIETGPAKDLNKKLDVLADLQSMIRNKCRQFMLDVEGR